MKITKFLASQPVQFCLFIFGLGLFVWPFLAAPSVSTPQEMFLYLFIAWGVLLLLLFFISRACREELTPESKSSKEQT